MTTKADLAHMSEITKQVKKEEQDVVDGAKHAVHDAKKEVEILAKKTDELQIKDAPDRLLPSADKIDQKLANLQDNLDSAQHKQIHDKNVENYHKVGQVLKDASRIVQDERNIVKNAAEDGSVSGAITDVANLAQEIADESWASLDTLWTNWTALVTVLAAGSAGSWKQLITESGRLLNDLRYTEDFLKLINDLKASFGGMIEIMGKNQPAGAKAEEAQKQWVEQRGKIVSDLQGLWAFLSKSPIWNQLVKQGKALGAQTSKVGDETKGQLQESFAHISNSENLKKLKEDLKGILQVIVGTNGPSVQPFLDYSTGAWEDIMTGENFSKWAAEAQNLYESFTASPEDASQEEYQKKLQVLYDGTKEILDTTVKNENLRLALRESKKLIKAAKKDPNTRKLIADSQKLLKDVSAKPGQGIINPALLDEIRGLLVPVLVHHLDNAPLPDYHGFSENALGKFDYHLRDMRLGTSGLIPSKIKIEFRYKTIANPSKLEITKQQMYMYMYMDDIHVSIKDTKWNYNRNTIPRFSDDGTLDLCTAGRGISITLKALVNNYHQPEGAHSLGELLEPPKEFKMFDVAKCDVSIDDFHVRVTDTKSNVFYEMLAGVWGTKIKHQIETLIETKLRNVCGRFDRQIYDVVRRTAQPSLFQEAKSSILSAGESLTDLPSKIREGVEEAKLNIQSL